MFNQSGILNFGARSEMLNMEIKQDYLSPDKKETIDFTELIQQTKSNFNRIVVQADSNFAKASSPFLNKRVDFVINHRKLNHEKHLSKHFQLIYQILNEGGTYIGCVETNNQRKQTRSVYSIPFIGFIYGLLDFTLHRFLPKIKFGKFLYTVLTGGKRRRLTKTEILGRLVYHGFTIEEILDNHEGKLYFLVRRYRNRLVYLNNQKPSYGPLYKMPRIGKHGSIIHVYKFRTMHPYSEFLQDYILKQNGYAESGKLSNDFRIAKWGKVMRKYWLDEIPQLINVFQGNMKLIGVRPVSQRYFEDIPDKIKHLRTKQKPGCIPPYVAFNKKSSVAGVIEAEELYLRFNREGKRSKDFKLILLAVKNILIKGKRSA